MLKERLCFNLLKVKCFVEPMVNALVFQLLETLKVKCFQKPFVFCEMSEPAHPYSEGAAGRREVRRCKLDPRLKARSFKIRY